VPHLLAHTRSNPSSLPLSTPAGYQQTSRSYTLGRELSFLLDPLAATGTILLFRLSALRHRDTGGGAASSPDGA